MDDNTSIRRMVCKGIWPTAPRDFVVCSSWMELPDGSLLIFSRSAPDDFCGPKNGFVRGTVQVSGYWIQPLDTIPDDPLANQFKGGSSSGCKVTLLAHTELGGTLPSSVINMLSTSAPLKIFTAVEALLVVQ